MKTLFKAVVAGLVLLITSGSLFAQNLSQDDIFLEGVRDLDATSLEYCRTVGLNGVANDRPIPLRVRLAAAASSTTVTGTGAFANVAVGDLLIINNAGAVLYRTVMTRASADSITVNALLSTAALTNLQADYRKLSCGTADSSGAFQVGGAHSFSIQLIMAQFNAASMDYQIECRVEGPGKAWSVVSGPTNKTTTFNTIFTTDVAFSECRVGAKINTDDGGDTGANAEQFTVNVTKRF